MSIAISIIAIIIYTIEKVVQLIGIEGTTPHVILPLNTKAHTSADTHGEQSGIKHVIEVEVIESKHLRHID